MFVLKIKYMFTYTYTLLDTYIIYIYYYRFHFLPLCADTVNRFVQSWWRVGLNRCWSRTGSSHSLLTRWTSLNPGQFQRRRDSQNGTRIRFVHASSGSWWCLCQKHDSGEKDVVHFMSLSMSTYGLVLLMDLRGTATANFSGSWVRSLRRRSSSPLLAGPIRAMGRFLLEGWW